MLGFNGGLIGKDQTTSRTISVPGVWTLQEQMEAVRNNLWAGSGASGDPDFDKVSLLLRMDGINNSTTFIDSSLFDRTVTRVGNPVISTAVSKYGGSSGLFTAGTQLRVSASTSLQLPADFTIEVWVYPFSSADMIIGTSLGGNVQIFRLNERGIGNLSVYINAQIFLSVAAGIAVNVWQHLAISRQGANTRLFVNGIQKGNTNTTWTGNFSMEVLGAFLFNGNNFGNNYAGYMDDVRITKGLARYTSNFTPPGPL